MKYIRTEDGIFDQVNEGLVLASNPPQYELKKNGKHISYAFCRDCQLADTIEELCDGFLAIDIGIFGDREKFYQTLEEAAKDRTFLYDKLYGIVNGKKVAKMNGEGKLELL